MKQNIVCNFFFHNDEFMTLFIFVMFISKIVHVIMDTIQLGNSFLNIFVDLLINCKFKLFINRMITNLMIYQEKI